jgi:hypothetical protein
MMSTADLRGAILLQRGIEDLMAVIREALATAFPPPAT